MSELGQTLREAREEKGLSLDDLQEETKIQKRYLKAIEEGDFKQLPGDFYTRAFIKSYAEAVGLEFGTLTQQFSSEMPGVHRDVPDRRAIPSGGTGDEAPVRRTVRRNRSGSKRWSSFINRAITIVFILIVLMLIYILITGIMSHQGNQTGAKTQGTGSSVSFKGSSASSSDSSSSSSSSSTSSASSSSGQQVLKLNQTQGTTSTYTLTGTTKFTITVSTKTGLPAWFMAKDAKTNAQIQQGTVSNAGKKSYQFDASNVQSLSLRFGSVPNTSLMINGQPFSFPSTSTTQNIVINFSK